MVWLYVLGGVLLFLMVVILLLCLPICVVSGGYDRENQFTLSGRWLFYKSVVLPINRKKHEKKKLKKKKKRIRENKRFAKKKAKALKKGKKIVEKSAIEELLGGYSPTEFLSLLGTGIVELYHIAVWILKTITFTKFDLDVKVGGEDAADVAIDYGEICAGFYPAFGILYSNTNMKEHNVNICADYDADETTVDFSFRLRVSAIILIVIRYVFLPEIIREYI